MSVRAGKFFLKQRGKKGTYQICWYEGRQTKSLSCGTSDVSIASDKLFYHALNHDKPKQATDDQLAAILARYYEQHARHLPSAGQARLGARAAITVFGDADVSALDRRRQLVFVQVQRAAGYSDWTIQNQLGRVWAALNWARRDNAALIVPDMITAADWRPVLPNRERVYSVEELAALFNAAAAHEHWWRFMALAIGTAGREAAIRELTWDQVDARTIELNPEGRRQTKKRRATVPIAPTLALELDSWEHDGETVVSNQGRAVRSREFFDRLMELTGLDGGPNAIRHTVRTWLAEHGVPDSDADLFMGHKGSGSHTGARYTHRRPDYLTSVKAALEALYAAIQPHLTTRKFKGPRVNFDTSSLILLDQPEPYIHEQNLDQILAG